MNDWQVTLIVGLAGALSGFGGQALYWGIFKGRIEARTDAAEENIKSLQSSRSEMWTELNSHDVRIAKLETVCSINHQARH